MRGISWLAENRLTFQEGLCSMELDEFPFSKLLSMSLSWVGLPHSKVPFLCLWSYWHRPIATNTQNAELSLALIFSIIWVTDLDKMLLRALSSSRAVCYTFCALCLSPEQFVIRSAPFAFHQSSSLYVLRPLPFSRAVRYTICALCIPQDQFVIRSAPCAFHKTSSLYVLRPVHSTRPVRYTFCALCLPPDQFVIRSAPCAFLQISSLYVLRPNILPGRSFVCIVQILLYDLSLSLSLSLSLCSPLFHRSM
jgi:hypothetical protein